VIVIVFNKLKIIDISKFVKNGFTSGIVICKELPLKDIRNLSLVCKKFNIERFDWDNYLKYYDPLVTSTVNKVL